MTSRRTRFERLESERAGEPVLRGPSLEGRFGLAPAVPPGATATEPPPRSGAQAERFQEGEPASPALRVLDLEGGQPFVRCARCRGDHHATAVRCTGCDADLTTREQREFNEAFWKQRTAEDADYELEVERLRLAREDGEREAAAAARMGGWVREGAVRRTFRISAGEIEARDVVVEAATWAGRAIGGWLRRVLKRG